MESVLFWLQLLAVRSGACVTPCCISTDLAVCLIVISREVNRG